MSSLFPDVIISNILSRLPVKSVLRFRCVCKSWCRLFRHPKFIKLHLDHETEKENFSLLWDYQGKICSTDYNYECSLSSLSSLLYNETVNVDCSIDFNDLLRMGLMLINNSCNGVVCLTAPGIVILWNPSTRESTRIISRRDAFIGFGYDSDIGEFKMVELSRINPMIPTKRKRNGVGSSHYSDWENCLRVYSFESNSWKVIPKVSYKITSYEIVFFKGAFHWLARPCDGSKQVLVSFLMKDKRFQEVLLPQHFYQDNTTLSATRVGVVGGVLALIHTVYNIRTEIWLMKEFGGINSWTQHCFINLRIIREHPIARLTVMRSFKNCELLLQMYPPSQDGTRLFLYDPNQGKGRAVDIHDMPQKFKKQHSPINSYIRTLTWVGSNTSEEATQRKMTLRSWTKRHLQQ
ncbi:hypothetical protein C5167_045101 [Papaver somniferum]|uniref:F-box domain-containing protein n=1 Tax=Papaver somniferum TaxID=3469 RepID=A0A4Y7LDQ4_PAPSO|nr:F-box/kelch-repeat protein At3g06240-like [Papaver somniferum]RZC82315.1 hypothetical protein C5167_045101 [Papaver somniferum]